MMLWIHLDWKLLIAMVTLEDHMSKYNQMLYMNLSSATVSSMILLLTGMPLGA